MGVRAVTDDDLLRARAQELYALALADADWTPESVCSLTGWSRAELDDALHTLASFGLTTRFPSSRSGWSVHSPATAMAQLVEGSRRRTEELVRTITDAHAALSQVAGEFQPVHMRHLAEARIEVAAQPAQIAAILDEGASTATTEILSMHPTVPGEIPCSRPTTATVNSSTAGSGSGRSTSRRPRPCRTSARICGPTPTTAARCGRPRRCP